MLPLTSWLISYICQNKMFLFSPSICKQKIPGDRLLVMKTNNPGNNKPVLKKSRSSSLVQLQEVIINKPPGCKRCFTICLYAIRLLSAPSGFRLMASYVPLSTHTRYCRHRHEVASSEVGSLVKSPA